MVRSWFRIGRGDTRRWKKKKYEIRTGYKKDTASLDKFITELESRLNGLTSFNSYMDKIEIAQDRTLKVRKMRLGSDQRGPIVAAEWVDDEIQASLKERKKRNKK